MRFGCGEGPCFEPWQPDVLRLPWGAGKSKKTASFLSVQKATLGYRPLPAGARSVLPCHAVWVWRRRFFRALAAGRFEAAMGGGQRQKDSFVGAESDVRDDRPVPSFTAMLFECGAAKALFSSLGSRAFWGWGAGKGKKTASFLIFGR